MTDRELLRELEAFLRDEQHGQWSYSENGYQARDLREWADKITARLSEPEDVLARDERRKSNAWCKEHDCPMHYCSHDRRRMR